MLAVHRAVKLSLALMVFAIGMGVVVIGMLFIGLSYWVSE
jgi:hypothetical protein